MEKSSTLNLRVNPDVKERAEAVLTRLGRMGVILRKMNDIIDELSIVPGFIKMRLPAEFLVRIRSETDTPRP